MFISTAYAAGTGAAISESGDFMTNFGWLAIMIVVMFFVFFRPQMKRQKELKSLMDALAKGDEVVTTGGLLGKIVKVADAYITLEIGTGTEVVVQRNAVTLLLPKGTIKGL